LYLQVPATGEVDRKYERDMREIISKRDNCDDEQERNRTLRGQGTTHGLSVFLGDALSTPQSLEALRKANSITHSTQGERAG
jgi:hypothetical protein